MTTSMLFLFGAFVSALVAMGMWLTVLEFRRIESGKVTQDSRFPL
jgi:hypothetical protein